MVRVQIPKIFFYPSTPREVEKEYKLLWLLLAFVLIGLAIWVYAKTNQFHHPKHKKNLGRALAFLILSFAVWLAFPDKLSDAKSIEWGQWSPELESALRKEGKAVYRRFYRKVVHGLSGK